MPPAQLSFIRSAVGIWLMMFSWYHQVMDAPWRYSYFGILRSNAENKGRKGVFCGASEVFRVSWNFLCPQGRARSKLRSPLGLKAFYPKLTSDSIFDSRRVEKLTCSPVWGRRSRRSHRLCEHMCALKKNLPPNQIVLSLRFICCAYHAPQHWHHIAL